MGKQEFSIPALTARLQTEADAYRLLEDLRWSGHPSTCPHCGGTDRCYFLNPSNGVSRKTRTGSASQRRVWKCGHCRKQFSVLTGTIFHGTKIPLRTWLLVVLEMCASKHGVAAREIERKYDLTAKSAWFMLHRIREAMRREPLASLLTGTVVADETWVGGNPKNKHRTKPGRQGKTDKTPVLALVDRRTGEVRSRVIPDVTAKTLHRALTADVDMPATTLHTDGHLAYVSVAPAMGGHEWVDHKRGEYVRDGVSTNLAETFFSQLKRSVDGTHHHVSGKHLPRYLAEFDYRFSTRKLSDSARLRDLMSRTEGRRISYRPVER